jgi:poly(3-hydroxybutyrate) depolymerase
MLACDGRIDEPSGAGATGGTSTVTTGGAGGVGSGGTTTTGGTGVIAPTTGGTGVTTGGAGGTGTGGSPPVDGGFVSDAGGVDAGLRIATPSAGCGKENPTSGTLAFMVDGETAEYVLTLPTVYDPDRPYPLGFAFHGRNRTGPNCHDGDCAGFDAAMHDQAVLVYMTALGGMLGWEGSSERERNVQYFEELRAHVEANYCIDTGREFVAGTSSGAHFVNILACRFGDTLLATAPVAGVLPEDTGCKGEIAALVIHGVDDIHVAFSEGEKARDHYLARNHCASTSVPAVATLHPEVVADRESHQCAVYDDCDAGKPVVWCEHSEGGYDGSTHGWPLFGGDRIWEFVETL